MTTELDTTQVLDTLRDVLLSSDSDTARISAAKLLLDRFTPDDDDAAQKHEAEERESALAEARGLLVEFAAVKLAGFRAARALDQERAAGSADA